MQPVVSSGNFHVSDILIELQHPEFNQRLQTVLTQFETPAIDGGDGAQR